MAARHRVAAVALCTLLLAPLAASAGSRVPRTSAPSLEALMQRALERLVIWCSSLQTKDDSGGTMDPNGQPRQHVVTPPTSSSTSGGGMDPNGLK